MFHVAALKLIEDCPKAVIYIIATLNYLVMPGKGAILLLYGLHIMHLSSLYCISSILLRSRLKGIAGNRSPAADLMLNNQERVTQELKGCIKQDVQLKTFCTAIIDHLKWILMINVTFAVIIMSLLYYTNLFVSAFRVLRIIFLDGRVFSLTAGTVLLEVAALLQ